MFAGWASCCAHTPSSLIFFATACWATLRASLAGAPESRRFVVIAASTHADGSSCLGRPEAGAAGGKGGSGGGELAQPAKPKPSTSQPLHRNFLDRLASL